MPLNTNRVGWVGDILNHRDETGYGGLWPYLRSSNWGAGSVRRFITLGSPFKGSSIANSAKHFFAPGDPGPNEPVPAGYALLIAWWQSGNLHNNYPDFANILFTGPPPNGAYIEPTCLSDLSVGSEAQLALELASYPTGHRHVRWFPCVGIATAELNEAPVQAVLWELLYFFVPLIPDNPLTINELSPSNSDLIVSAMSQRNSSGAGHPNEMAGQAFSSTAHSPVPAIPLPGETESTPIRVKVGELLSGWPSVYSSFWSLGP